MKININKNELLGLLKYPVSIIENNNINPILNSVLLKVSNGQLECLSTNNLISVFNTTNKLQIEENGNVLIRGKMFINILSKIKENEVKVETLENSILRVSTPKYSCDINLLEDNSFPNINFKSDGLTPIKLPDNYFKEVVNKLLNIGVPSIDQITPLNGVLFDSTREEGILESIATDGKHLGYISYPYQGEKFKIILNIENLKIISELLQNNQPILYLNNNNLLININSLIFNCRLTEGQYPSAINTLESPQQFEFKVNKNELFNAIDRSNVISANPKNGILFNISPNKLQITSRSVEYGSSFEELSITNYEGQPLTVFFNPIFLINLIKNISSPTITFKFTSNNKPFFILDENNTNYKSLILPIRQN